MERKPLRSRIKKASPDATQITARGLEGIEIITKSLAGIERGYIFATDQHRGGFIAAIKEG